MNNKDSKPRPVKIALTEADEKHRIMKNLSRIKETPMHLYIYNVGFSG
jgi:hypothetical protein